MIGHGDQVSAETDDRDFDALSDQEDSTAGEIHSLIQNEKEDLITFEEYAKRRGIQL